MLENYNTSPYTVSALSAGGQYIRLSEGVNDLGINAFKDYDWVGVQIWWDSVDAFDGSVYLCERANSRVPRWDTVPNQVRGITTAAGSCKLMDVDLLASEVSVLINKGSATTGNFYYFVKARKQYGMEDVVTEIKKIADGMFSTVLKGTKTTGLSKI